MTAGLPISITASIAARTVRPVNKTSSTKITCLPVTSTSILVSFSSGSSVGTTFCKSSRYKVISNSPIGTSIPSICLIFSCNRFAKGTPLVLIPTSTRSKPPLFFSRISWAILVSERLIVALSSNSVFFLHCCHPYT